MFLKNKNEKLIETIPEKDLLPRTGGLAAALGFSVAHETESVTSWFLGSVVTYY